MEIYEPAEDSFLLQKSVKEYAFGRVLDIGTGSGIQALTAIQSPKVREVVAVDINAEAIAKLKEKVRAEKLRKLNPLVSDLFSEVEGKFDLIIFNPPYLPQDRGIEDPALYGGKKGWEIISRFLKEASGYLMPTGKILLLFSSLTDKDKVEWLISENLFVFSEWGKEKISFETLYVYDLEKSGLLRQLESKGIKKISFFRKGCRGKIFLGEMDTAQFIKSHLAKKQIIKVAIKSALEESQAIGRIENESKWLKILNQKGLGPRLWFSAENYLVESFIEGKPILDWLGDKETVSSDIIAVLKEILKQCYILDELKVNKEEMHHPLKHIIITAKHTKPVPVMIDFERCKETDNVKNVTQFVEFIIRIKDELENKKINIAPGKLRELAKIYKEENSLENLENILKSIK